MPWKFHDGERDGIDLCCVEILNERERTSWFIGDIIRHET